MMSSHPTLDVVRELLTVGLYESAEACAHLLINDLMKLDDARQLADVYAFIGDSLNNPTICEYRRALHYYSFSRQYFDRAGVPMTDVAHTAVVRSIIECHRLLGEHDIAVKLVDSLDVCEIPISLAHLMYIAHHFLLQNDRARAARCYQRVLTAQPYALEAARALESLHNDILPEDLPRSAPVIMQTFHPDLPLLVQAQTYNSQYQFTQATQLLKEICERHPYSAIFLHWQTLAALQCQDNDDVCLHFVALEELEPTWIEDVEVYALLLRSRGESRLKKLSDLRMRVMKHHPDRCQGWLVAALSADVNGMRQECEKLLDRAFVMATKNPAPCHHVRAHIALFSYCSVDPALQSYQQALALTEAHQPTKPIVHLSQGYINALVAGNHINKSLHAVNNLLVRNRRNPKLLTLTAFVLSHTPHGIDKAKRALVKAIAIDPFHRAAAMALADLYCASGEFAACLTMLTQSLQHNGAYDAGICAKLGQVHAWHGDRLQAIQFYQRAIEIDNQNKLAAQGLIELENDIDKAKDGIVQ